MAQVFSRLLLPEWGRGNLFVVFNPTPPYPLIHSPLSVDSNALAEQRGTKIQEKEKVDGRGR